MEFTAPVLSGYTIYGKTNCPYCVKAKDILEEFNEEYTYINCDDYLLADKEAFLEFIEKAAGKAHKTFPMIFSSGKFVGGYMDLCKILLDTDE